MKPLAAIPTRVIDGDTFVADVRWFRRAEVGVSRHVIRVAGVRARELHDRAAQDPAGLGRLPGPLARDYLAGQLLPGLPQPLIFLDVITSDAWGRLVCEVFFDPDEADPLAPILFAAHAASPGSTEGRALLVPEPDSDSEPLADAARALDAALLDYLPG